MGKWHVILDSTKGQEEFLTKLGKKISIIIICHGDLRNTYVGKERENIFYQEFKARRSHTRGAVISSLK